MSGSVGSGTGFDCDCSIEDLIRWWKANPTDEKNVLYLCDYDLKNRSKTGVDVIRELSIERKAVLVTSYYYKKDLQNACSAIGLKVLPKDLMDSVPIRAEG